MKKIILILFLVGCAPDIPDIPVTEKEIEDMQEQLDVCVDNLEWAKQFLEGLALEIIWLKEDLKKCIEGK